MAESWTKLECEAIVADYFEMLYAELCGESYSKADHRRTLREKLNSRSDGSVEYKHQNISAALLKAGHLYIKGYKPAWNYQSLLEEVVLSRLFNESGKIIEFEDEYLSSGTPKQKIINFEALFVTPPERIVQTNVQEGNAPNPRHINYSEREARNRTLGESGEKFVMEVEKNRLLRLGRDDLVNDIEWVSKSKGDGAGYDIRSFNGNTDEELFIEVKTTNAGKYQPFIISNNEVNYSDRHRESYSLYRVFDFRERPSIFALNGLITNHVHMTPQQFKASFN